MDEKKIIDNSKEIEYKLKEMYEICLRIFGLCSIQLVIKSDDINEKEEIVMSVYKSNKFIIQ